MFRLLRNLLIFGTVSVSQIFGVLATDMPNERGDDDDRRRGRSLLRYNEQYAQETLMHKNRRGMRGDDDRRKINCTTKDKYKAIGQLKLKFPDGSAGTGTGFLVSERDVLTAGHCLYDHEAGGWAESVTFIPARDGAYKPLGRIDAEVWRVPAKWRQKQDKDFDYGVITLEERVHSNFFRLSSEPKDLLEEETYNITGYPGEKDKIGEMWTIKGQLYDVDSFRVLYALDTTAGQSGGPIWRRERSHNICVGVHTNGFTQYSSEKVNGGVRFRSYDLDSIRGMIRKNHKAVRESALIKSLQKLSIN